MKNSIIIYKLVYTILALLVLADTACERPVLAQATSRGGERYSQIRWDGVWDTSYGHMELGQVAHSVFGTYENDEGVGRINGTVNAQTLIISWSNTSEYGDITSGHGEFVMSDDNNSFEGYWNYSGDSEEYDWTGYRVEDREVFGSRSRIDYCLWRGSWEIDDGVMILVQDIEQDSVVGEFMNQDGYGTVRGNADGWVLEFDWEIGELSGVSTIEMSGDLSSFNQVVDNDEIPEGMEWSGVFLSSTLRENFSGSWDTNWGTIMFSDIDSEGNINAIIRDARIGDQTGDCVIDGNVLGPVCRFNWMVSGGFYGYSTIELHERNESFTGEWVSGADSEVGGKLTGQKI